MLKDRCFILFTAVTTNYCKNDRFVPSEVLLIIDLHALPSTIKMYLLLLDKLYSLRLWSEQTRQMNLPRLQKLCKPMSCCPGYQGFFLACDGELRFVDLRPTSVARVTWPKSETAHEKPLPPRVMSCLSVRVRVWPWEFVVHIHNDIDAVCHPRCLRSKYV